MCSATDAPRDRGPARGRSVAGRRAAREFPISRPAISQHLRVLKHARLVVDRADGTRRMYVLNPEAFDALRAHFDGYWSRALAAFKRQVEAPPTKEKQ